MIKLSCFLTRREDLTHEQFTRYWIDKHAPLVETLPEAQQLVRRYVQQDVSTALPDEMPGVTFDGIAELWFDDVEAAVAAMASANYASIVAADEENFLDRAKTQLMISEERHSLWTGK